MFNTDFIAWVSGFIVCNPFLKVLTDRHWTIIKAHAELCNAQEEGQCSVFTETILQSRLDLSQLSEWVERFMVRQPWLEPKQIFYFLQGHFEITENSTSLNQVQIIHMTAVIENCFSGIGESLQCVYNMLGESEIQVEEISTIINETFLHVIDPSYGNDEKKDNQLQLIHDQYKNRPDTENRTTNVDTDVKIVDTDVGDREDETVCKHGKKFVDGYRTVP